MAELPESDPSAPKSSAFTPEVLDQTVIAIPLLKILKDERDEEAKARKARKRYTPKPLGVILDLNLEYRLGRDECRDRVRELVAEAIARAATKKASGPPQGINEAKSEFSNQYMFARLEPSVIRELVRLDNPRALSGEEQGETYEQRMTRTTQRAIYRIWPDFEIKLLTTKSVSTVKADAARVSFSAFGEDIVWAVIDSGIDGEHPHFKAHKNLELNRRSATGTSPRRRASRWSTSSAMAPTSPASSPAPCRPRRCASRRSVRSHAIATKTATSPRQGAAAEISGMAPQCKLLSLKVLDDNGNGEASNLIAAIEYIQEINGNGRRLRIHGVNMSVGYDFEPEWFACGQSPLCVEVDRLVRSGVVVVVAAGNTGYGCNQDALKGAGGRRAWT